MFSSSAIALARRRPPFPVFYKSMMTALTDTKGPKRMQIAAALWHTTTKEFGSSASPQRTAKANELYKKYGAAVLRLPDAKKPSTKIGSAKLLKTIATPAARRKVSAKSSNSKKKTKTAKRHRADPRRRRSAATPHKYTAPSYAAFCQRVVPPGIRTPPVVYMRALYTATHSTRVQLSRQRREEIARRLVRSYHGTVAAARARRPAPKRKAAARRQKTAAVSTPYAAFRDAVMRRARLPPSSQTSRRVYRAWVATGQQNSLSASKRVDMAVGLLRKGEKTSKRLKLKPKTSVVRKRSATAAAKKTKGSTKRKSVAKRAKGSSGRKKSAGKGRRNPYITFYREMRMTGNVPNHPRGAGTRVIKELWRRTHHLSDLNARIRLSEDILAGRAPLPPRPATKPVPNKAKRSAKKPRTVTSASRKLRKATTHRVAKTAAVSKSGVVDFKVPPTYAKHPFAATYSALYPHLPDMSGETRMTKVANAWSKSEVRNDTRTPRERITAVSKALQ